MDKVVPGLAAESVANNELENVEREVGDEAVDPDHSGPAPSDALDPGEAPGRVHRDRGSHLQENPSVLILLFFFLSISTRRFRNVCMAHQLRGDESGDEQETGALDKGPAPRPRNEDERLADYTHLEVQCRHKFVLMLPDRPHSKDLLHPYIHVMNELLDQSIYIYTVYKGV